MPAAALLVFAWTSAYGQENLSAPPGTKLVLETVADGVQVYMCTAENQTFAWVFKQPEAALFDQQGRQIGIHFAGPSWRLDDGGTVAGEVTARADAPDHTSIPWLLLRAKSHEGQGQLSAVTFIRRAETKGGAAPRSGCDASRAGESARMRYSAIYQFFAPN
jgi:FtsP/CotA-like multicopper oxidase with cupredoxin domain